ncbi:MAG: DUF2167 domain-containing protein [Cyanobacteriota bacterium]
MNKTIIKLLMIILLPFILCIKVNCQDITWQDGPKTIPIANDLASVYIPNNFVFAETEEAKKYLKKNYVKTTEFLTGLIMSSDASEMWFILLEYKDFGYVKEEMLNNIDPNQFLEGIKLMTNGPSNNGFNPNTGIKISNPLAPSIEINGLKEDPYYDETNNTVKSIVSLKQGKLNLVNYLYMVFGSKGIIVARLVCEEDKLPELREKVDYIFENIQFNHGNKYANFNPDKDKYAFSRGSDFLNFLTEGKINLDDQKPKNKVFSDLPKKGNNPITKPIGFDGIPISLVIFGGIAGVVIIYFAIKGFFA